LLPDNGYVIIVLRFVDRSEIRMTITTVSSKYQIVIPKEIRERLKIRPGQKLQMIEIGRRIELIPVEPIQNARGFLKGMDTSNYRDEEDREI
jgi:AbrB family looped-hinge helix DNA binding protein